MTHSSEAHRLAVDVGGTFIDYVLLNEATGEVVVEKQPARAETLEQEFMSGLSRLPVTADKIDRFIHGTTVAINTLVQELGVKTGLLTTRGFRDVLELGRGGRAEIYNPLYQPAKPLVRRQLRREIPERMSATGQVLAPLDTEALRREVEFLVAHDVRGIAICFLHSYVNHEHEAQAAEFIRTHYPEISVTASSEIVTEWREFERTSTTVINAYTQPRFSAYANNIRALVAEAGYTDPIAFMRSNGGVMPLEVAGAKPVETLGSGPAGGVIGAHALIQQTQRRNVICADVGGTTYDVALIYDGNIIERTETKIAHRPVVGSVIDIVSVGAGGGSIATIDDMTGSLRVGPESAGAQPGPAAFDAGGQDPTVTDAQVVLGMLDPVNYLGGRMQLNVDKARAAIETKLQQDRPVEELAAGILAVAQANMANAIRLITTQRGLDVREFAMLSYGGGGGMFAAGVCDELGVREILVPANAAGFSAWGMLAADYREDVGMTRVTAVETETFPQIVDLFDTLASQSKHSLREYGFQDDLQVRLTADIRYVGQEHTINTPIPADFSAMTPQQFQTSVQEVFTELHQQLYGHGNDTDPVQIVTLRATAVAAVAKPQLRAVYADTPAEPQTHRDIYFGGHGWCKDVPVYHRADFANGQRVFGPAIVDEWTTTVVVPPTWTAWVDPTGNLVLRKEGA